MAKNRRSRGPRGREVFEELKDLVTERSNLKSAHIDRVSTKDALRIINSEDATVAGAVRRELPYIARAVDYVVSALEKGGRLFYLGAGTSGRLGVLDAAECPPTFGTPSTMIQGIIAGGYRSLLRSREGVEDDVSAARKDIRRRNVRPGDVVIGITASKRTPYVLAGLSEAKKIGAATIFISCNPRSMAPKQFDLAICPMVGPEVIAGSSRMKAGTAQKMALNMISTASMIRCGKIYGNRMVDLKATSEKLRERSKRTLMETCHLSYNDADKALSRAGGSVKIAIVMVRKQLSRAGAGGLLQESAGSVSRALGEKN
ncbi:MAG: N-acetylmuramic acid 6-phosphate etherase [candidate division Zixibacteria bacterium RBG_16_53_22]|nr:MAG: N-acetylmuramic acid 6-phosphate etherase [candidate division Zixibacteria bacterium RBG_16_53_22]